MQSSSLAIQLGRSADRGLDPDKAFPFIYPFIPSTEDTWDADHGVGPNGTFPLSRMGISIGPGLVRKQIFRTDPDCIYAAQSIRYTAYREYTRTLLALTGTVEIVPGFLGQLDTITGAGTAFWTELRANDIVTVAGQTLFIASVLNDTTAYVFYDATVPVAALSPMTRQAKTEFQWFDDQDLGLTPPASGYWLELLEPNLRVGTPLEQFIRVTFQVTSPNGRVIYGDVDQTPVNYGQDNRVFVNLLQGNDNGPGNLFTPNIFPPSSIITIEIENTHPTKTIVVGGAIFGTKVRL